MLKKKNYILILCAIMIFGGCAKSDLEIAKQLSHIDQTDLLTLSEIKDHLRSKRERLSPSSRSAPIGFEFLTQADEDILWKKSYKVETHVDFPVFMVPIATIESIYSIMEEKNVPSQKLLCFQHTPEHVVEQDIWILQPSEEYYASKCREKGMLKRTLDSYEDYQQVVDTHDYTGQITIYTADGRFKILYNYINGELLNFFDWRDIS